MIRRFSDFVWLRDQLQRDCPGYIIPPVPDKVLNKFSADLVAARQRQLERFLRRVASHPALMASSTQLWSPPRHQLTHARRVIRCVP